MFKHYSSANDRRNYSCLIAFWSFLEILEFRLRIIFDLRRMLFVSRCPKIKRIEVTRIVSQG